MAVGGGLAVAAVVAAVDDEPRGTRSRRSPRPPRARSTASAPSGKGFLAHISATSAFGSRTLRRIIEKVTDYRVEVQRQPRETRGASPRLVRDARRAGDSGRSSRSRFERRDSRDTPASSATAPSASSSSCSRDKRDVVLVHGTAHQGPGGGRPPRDRPVASAPHPSPRARTSPPRASTRARRRRAARVRARGRDARARERAIRTLRAPICGTRARPPLRTRGRGDLCRETRHAPFCRYGYPATYPFPGELTTMITRAFPTGRDPPPRWPHLSRSRTASPRAPRSRRRAGRASPPACTLAPSPRGKTTSSRTRGSSRSSD